MNKLLHKYKIKKVCHLFKLIDAKSKIDREFLDIDYV